VGGFWSEKQQMMDFFYLMKCYYRYFGPKVMDWRLFFGLNYSFKWVIIFGPHDLEVSCFQCFILFTFIFASSRINHVLCKTNCSKCLKIMTHLCEKYENVWMFIRSLYLVLFKAILCTLDNLPNKKKSSNKNNKIIIRTHTYKKIR